MRLFLLTAFVGVSLLLNNGNGVEGAPGDNPSDASPPTNSAPAAVNDGPDAPANPLFRAPTFNLNGQDANTSNMIGDEDDLNQPSEGTEAPPSTRNTSGDVEGGISPPGPTRGERTSSNFNSGLAVPSFSPDLDSKLPPTQNGDNPFDSPSPSPPSSPTDGSFSDGGDAEMSNSELFPGETPEGPHDRMKEYLGEVGVSRKALHAMDEADVKDMFHNHAMSHLTDEEKAQVDENPDNKHQKALEIYEQNHHQKAVTAHQGKKANKEKVDWSKEPAKGVLEAAHGHVAELLKLKPDDAKKMRESKIVSKAKEALTHEATLKSENPVLAKAKFKVTELGHMDDLKILELYNSLFTGGHPPQSPGVAKMGDAAHKVKYVLSILTKSSIKQLSKPAALKKAVTAFVKGHKDKDAAKHAEALKKEHTDEAKFELFEKELFSLSLPELEDLAKAKEHLVHLHKDPHDKADTAAMHQEEHLRTVREIIAAVKEQLKLHHHPKDKAHEADNKAEAARIDALSDLEVLKEFLEHVAIPAKAKAAKKDKMKKQPATKAGRALRTAAKTAAKAAKKGAAAGGKKTGGR